MVTAPYKETPCTGTRAVLGQQEWQGVWTQQVCPPIEAAVDQPTVVVDVDDHDEAGFPCNAMQAPSVTHGKRRMRRGSFADRR